jgi:predicted membrane chloride channel (bestrophin family)
VPAGRPVVPRTSMAGSKCRRLHTVNATQVYIVVVCVIDMYVPLGGIKKQLEQLNGVTAAIGVLLFFLLSFRNNAAFHRWQTGTEKFKNFCAMAKLTTRNVANNIPSFVALGGHEAVDDLLGIIKWVMACVEMGRQHLRSDKSVIGLHDILTDEEVAELHAKHDPVLYCLYKALDVDHKYIAGKACEWMRLLGERARPLACAAADLHWMQGGTASALSITTAQAVHTNVPAAFVQT